MRFGYKPIRHCRGNTVRSLPVSSGTVAFPHTVSKAEVQQLCAFYSVCGRSFSAAYGIRRMVGAAHPTTERGSSLDHLFAVSVIADLAAIKRGKAMAKTCIVLPADMKRILEFSNDLIAVQSHQPSRFIP